VILRRWEVVARDNKTGAVQWRSSTLDRESAEYYWTRWGAERAAREANRWHADPWNRRQLGLGAVMFTVVAERRVTRSASAAKPDGGRRMGVDRARHKAMFAFALRGWSEQTVARAGFALHPIDDVGTRCAFADGSTGTAGVPGRAFEKAVRKRSRALAKSIKRANEHDAAQVADEAWAEYRQLAAAHGEDYYIKRFEQLATIEPEAKDG
jgi:hypothetical protein